MFFLRNIVATVNLDCRLDLKTIALHARNAEYNPKVLLTMLYHLLHGMLNMNPSVSRPSLCGFAIRRLLL